MTSDDPADRIWEFSPDEDPRVTQRRIDAANAIYRATQALAGSPDALAAANAAAQDRQQELRDAQNAWQRGWDARWRRNPGPPDATQRAIIASEWSAIRAGQAIGLGQLSPVARKRLRMALDAADQQARSQARDGDPVEVEDMLDYAHWVFHKTGVDAQFDDHLDWLKRHSDGNTRSPQS